MNRLSAHASPFGAIRMVPLLALTLVWGMVSLQAQTLTSEIIGFGPEGTTHRVYFDAPAGAEVLSVFASEAHPLSATSTTSFHQEPGLPDVLGQNGLLIPGADVDSWFSIGDGSLAGAANIGGAGWNLALSSFAMGGNFECSDAAGGAFYLTPGSAQGLVSDPILVGQFTSTGTVNVQLNVQWKPSADADAIESLGLTTSLQPVANGCTDPAAVNHDPSAIEDDGSCFYATNGFQGLEWEQAGMSDGVPVYRVYAVMDNPAEQVVSLYGSAADPLSIQSSAPFVQLPGGGVLPLAFDAGSDLVSGDSWVTIGTELNGGGIQTVGLTSAAFETGGALQSDAQFGGSWFVIPGNAPMAFPDADGRVLIAQLVTSGLVTFETSLAYDNADGDLQEVTGLILQFPAGEVGCTDPLACNYSPSATIDAPCQYQDALGVCGGDCAADEDADGICDDAEIQGCTDSTADNFNPAATEDDASCTYGPEEEDTTTFLGLTYEEVAVDLVDDTRTYRVYAEFDGANHEVVSVFGNAEDPLLLESEAGFHQSATGGPLASSIPGGTLYDDLAADSWLTIGGENAPTATGLQSVGFDFTDFESGGDLEVASTFGGGLFVVPGEQASATAGPDGRVLIGQFTSAGQMEWTLNLQYRTPDGSSPDVRGVSITFPDQVPGCVDPMACNTDAYAVVDDGSCVYPDGFPNHTLDCDGQCVSDVDGDGVCDPDEIAGCTDEDACNYNALATDDDGSCETPLAIYGSAEYDCAGTCLSDLDGDGICDGLEIGGCTSPVACNYDPTATDDDGSCENVTCAGCIDPSACNYDASATQGDASCEYVDEACEACVAGEVVFQDADGDGVCDGDEYAGCTDPNACNYDPLVDAANGDPALCDTPLSLHGSAYVDCDGTCLNDADLDGVCDEEEVFGCTYSAACNYVPAATQDDGSCTFAAPNEFCDGTCILDLNGDGICDDLSQPGCTYADAYNYDASATVDDGSCTFPQGACQADLDQDGDVTVSDLLDFLVYFADPCEGFSAE